MASGWSNRIHRVAAPLIAAAWLAGCGGGEKARPGIVYPGTGSVGGSNGPSSGSGEAPEWVMRTPRMARNICAVGAVDPTFYRQDGRTQAGEAARAELARTVQVKISTVMYEEQSTSGGWVDQATVQEVVGSVSDVVLAGAQVMEVWYDERGSVSRKGMTYALACMPTDESVAQFAEKLAAAVPDEEKKDKIQRVKENARLAFEELEELEAKKANP